MTFDLRRSLMNHLAADLWISKRRSSLFSDVTNRSGISALFTPLQMKTAVLTSTENYFIFQFAFAKFTLTLLSSVLIISRHAFSHLINWSKLLFKFCFLPDNFNCHIGSGPLTFGRESIWRFCCHGTEAVSVVWATCAGAHGSLINVMYRRNRSGEQEVLAKKKIDRAPLVSGMPCCIKSCLCIHMHTDVHATMHINTLTLACKPAGMHAVITNKTYTDVTESSSSNLYFCPPLLE